MNYYIYLQRAANETIAQAENGLYYLEPNWRVILYVAELTPDVVSDTELTWDGVKEWLELQVKKLNTEQNKIPEVVNWIYETITAVIEPEMLEHETSLVQAVKEHLQKENLPTKEE